MFERGGNNC